MGKYLSDVEQSDAVISTAKANFDAIEDRAFFLKPSDGVTIGPPTSGTFAVDELWIDVLRSTWICTIAGSPGSWKQIVAAVASGSFPVGTIPTGYEVIRDDLDRKRWRWDGSAWAPINRKTFNQVSPALTWGPFTHGMGVRPAAASVYINGQIWGVQIVADTTSATVNLDFAKSGVLELEF